MRQCSMPWQPFIQRCERLTLKPIRDVARTLILFCGATSAAVTVLSGAALAADRALSVQQTAPGVFVHYGKHEEASPSNVGAIANVGFIVGDRCVAVIDTGGTLENGNRLYLAIRKISALPVCYVINTHFHPDHVFGNAAFVGESPQFIGHQNLAAALRARERFYLKALSDAVGEEIFKGTTVVPPTVEVASVRTIDLGGRTLLIQAWQTAHTNTDLTVLDNETRTMWLGDLLFEKRIPSIDGSVKGWLSVMDELKKVNAKQVIPGHGAPSTNWPGALDAQAGYLNALMRDVRQALKEKKSLRQAVQQAAQDERPNWLLFDDYHARNVTTAYTELEWED